MIRKIFTNRISYGVFSRRSSSNGGGNEVESRISLNQYQDVSDNTLEELSEKLDSILEDQYDKGADVSLTNGVLTVTIDDSNTFVINKQTPNRQLWFSSPLSGPKRFDLISGQWIDKYTNVELKDLLSKELSKLLKNQVKLDS